jgi:signal transduction histidine kinase
MISGPITELAHAMTRVARDKNYALRVKKRSNDEVGTLIDRFNDMLVQIGAHEASLTAARMEAEASSRATSAFLANTSHELRTPLNAIIGFSEVIKHQTMGGVLPAYVSYADDIWESGKRLLDIINGLLDLSKIEAGKFKLAADHIDVSDVIARAIRMIGEIGKPSDLAIDVSIEPDHMILEADDRLIRQCLLNLLSNAIKFTPVGGRVQVSAAVDGDGCPQLSVSDTGIGIEQSDLATILLPFGQVEKAYNRKHSGTGLGLTLVRKFIELHGGRLEIDSKPGVGTIATLRLPAERLMRGSAADSSCHQEPCNDVVAETPRERGEISSSVSLKAAMTR